MLCIYTSTCGLWARKSKLSRVVEQSPPSARITHLSQQPAGWAISFLWIVPIACILSESKLIPVYLCHIHLLNSVNYPQIANDGILWQPVGFCMAGPDYKTFNEDYGSLGASNFIWDFYKELLVFGSCWKLPVLLCTQCLFLQERYFLRRQICSCSFEMPRESPGAGMAYVQN